jgi:hypothetical protein
VLRAKSLADVTPIRHLSAMEATRVPLRRRFTCLGESGNRLDVRCEIRDGDDDPHAVVSVFDDLTCTLVRTGRVNADVKLDEAAVRRFVRTGEA